MAAPHELQNLALLLIREKQCGQTVSRSRSCSVKSAPQNSHLRAPSERGAPHFAQQTTAASWARGSCTVSTVPQWQRNRLPMGRAEASYCRLHFGQATRRRMEMRNVESELRMGPSQWLCS